MHPILFSMGPITIYTYGAIIALTFILCVYLMRYNAHLVGIDKNKILDFVIVILISGLIGARILHVLVNLEYYIKFPTEIIMIQKGGLAFYGGVISAFVCGYIYLKINAIPVWMAADIAAPYAALCQAIGRIGCFFNGCCFGKIYHGAFGGTTFPGESVSRYPTQIYSVISLLAVYAILRFMLQKHILRGHLIFVYLGMYSFQRFFIEFLRGDINRAAFNLTVSQHISIAIFIFALASLIYRKKKGNGKV